MSNNQSWYDLIQRVSDLSTDQMIELLRDAGYGKRHLVDGKYIGWIIVPDSEVNKSLQQNTGGNHKEE